MGGIAKLFSRPVVRRQRRAPAVPRFEMPLRFKKAVPSVSRPMAGTATAAGRALPTATAAPPFVAGRAATAAASSYTPPPAAGAGRAFAGSWAPGTRPDFAIHPGSAAHRYFGTAASAPATVAVGPGKVAFLPIGTAVVATAPHLAVCTAILFKCTDASGKLIGFAMGHRQPNDAIFKDNLRKAYQDHPGTWTPLAVEHANNHVIDDGVTSEGSKSSLFLLAEDVAEITGADRDAIEKMGRKAPRMSDDFFNDNFYINEMTVTIDHNGHYAFKKRSAIGIVMQKTFLGFK